MVPGFELMVRRGEWSRDASSTTTRWAWSGTELLRTIEASGWKPLPWDVEPKRTSLSNAGAVEQALARIASAPDDARPADLAETRYHEAELTLGAVTRSSGAKVGQTTPLLEALEALATALDANFPRGP